MDSDATTEWDASMPGAGAQRATAITQLYFRMVGYGALTILVADALCYAFAESGATVAELAAYLGLAEERVAAALDAIPSDLRCTSRDLPSASDTAAKEEVRHYFNYKQLLPTVYAHLTHVLLALCMVPLPVSARGATEVAGGEARATTLAEPANVSAVLRQREARDGIYCASCRSYSALQEFATTVSRCPVCHVDVLRATLDRVKRDLDDRCTRGESLVTLLPSQAPQERGPAARHVVSGSARAPETEDVALARDPFLVQQALAFVYLYSVPLAYVNDARCVVRADDILTGAEYERRMQGKVSIADEFRAAHRHPGTLHVRILAQADVDAARRAASAQKLAKRTRLPPWLRPGAGGDVAGVTHNRDAVRQADQAPLVAPDLTRAARFVAKEFYEDDFDDVALAPRRVRF